MKNVQIVTLLLTLYHLPTFSKEQILMINLSPNDQEISKEFNKRVLNLKNCGFDVKTLSGKNIEEIRSKARSLSLNQIKITHIDGHGTFTNQLLDNRHDGSLVKPAHAFRFSSEFNNATLTKPNDLFDVLKPKTGNTPLWIDTCFGGSCDASSHYSHFGSACSPESRTTNCSPITPLVHKLLCSSINDCQEWYQADINHDGHLNQKEFRDYLSKKINSQKKRKYEESFWIHEDKNIEQFQKTCHRLNGQLEKEKYEMKPYIYLAIEKIFYKDKKQTLKEGQYEQYAEPSQLPKIFIEKMNEISKSHMEKNWTEQINIWLSQQSQEKLITQEFKTNAHILKKVKWMRKTFINLKCHTEIPFKERATSRFPISAVPGTFELTSEKCTLSASQQKKSQLQSKPLSSHTTNK